MEDFKKALKNCSIEELASMVSALNQEIEAGRYRKTQTQHKVVCVLSQKKPRVCSQTREQYKKLCSLLASVKNSDVKKRLNTFMKENNI